MNRKKARRPVVPEYGSDRYEYELALSRLGRALTALQGGFVNGEGRIETGIHCRVGYAEGALAGALDVLNRLQIERRLKVRRE